MRCNEVTIVNILTICNRLKHIDESHSVDFAKDLKRLEKFSSRITLEPHQILYEDVKVDRGLFFIEQGIVKVERDADATVTRKGNGDTFSRAATNNWGSLNQLKCADVARAIADMKAKGNKSWEQRSFRVARYVFSIWYCVGHPLKQTHRLSRRDSIGPGWIIGMNEALSNTANPGVNIAGT